MAKLDLQLWPKAPKYEDVVRAIEKDYKVKLPERTALTFWDSFAMSHYRDMVAGLEGGQEAGRSHQQMEAAMEQAAGGSTVEVEMYGGTEKTAESEENRARSSDIAAAGIAASTAGVQRSGTLSVAAAAGAAATQE